MEPKLTWYLEPRCRGPCVVDTDPRYGAGTKMLRVKCALGAPLSPVAEPVWVLLFAQGIDEEHRETSAQNFLLLAEIKLAEYLAQNGIEADTPQTAAGLSPANNLEK